jgi:hypothetical protein
VQLVIKQDDTVIYALGPGDFVVINNAPASIEEALSLAREAIRFMTDWQRARDAAGLLHASPSAK